MRHCQP